MKIVTEHELHALTVTSATLDTHKERLRQLIGEDEYRQAVRTFENMRSILRRDKEFQDDYRRKNNLPSQY